MPVDGYTISGAALVYVGTGTAGALELLGYTQGGVDFEVTEEYEPILTDIFGPRVPQDFQNMGMVASINCPLIAMDRTVLAKVTGRGDRTTLGQVSTPGMVMGVAGYAFKVAIASSADSPWTFVKCIMRPSFGTKLATKANPFMARFYAWPWATYTVTTGKDQTLWNRILA